MVTAGIDAALLLHPRDVLYYAGTVRPAALSVTQRDAVLLVRRGLEWARLETSITRVKPMEGFAALVETCRGPGLDGGVLGTELDVVSVHVYHRLTQSLEADAQRRKGAGWSVVDVSPLVLAQRAVKDEEEIAVLRRAAAIADIGQAAVPRTAAGGLSELALAAEVEAAMRRAGHEGFQPLRYPEARGAGVLMMSGPHLSIRGGHGLVVTGAGLSPAMPYGPSTRRLRKGDLVVLDVGATCDGYTSDEARTYVVGPATAAQDALVQVTSAAQDAVFAALRPGVSSGDLLAAAEEVVARGAPPHFCAGSLTLPGFVGHGLGLEIDEPPVLWRREETLMQQGMVLAIEVEVSVPASGWMAKLEDAVVILADGCQVLTKAPRRLLELGAPQTA